MAFICPMKGPPSRLLTNDGTYIARGDIHVTDDTFINSMRTQVMPMLYLEGGRIKAGDVPPGERYLALVPELTGDSEDFMVGE